MEFIISSTGLTLIFLLLKVFGGVTWSWRVVFSPIWVPVVFIIFAAVVASLLK